MHSSILTIVALAQTTTAEHVFYQRDDLLLAVDTWCTDSTAAEVTYGVISHWDVRAVRDLSYLFCGSPDDSGLMSGCRPVKRTCNPDISGWDMSGATDMSNMFRDAHAFNQPVNAWSVGKVRAFGGMFHHASSFNQLVHAWDVSEATTMHSMFKYATSFNRPLNSWNVRKLSTTTHMFYGASAWDQPLGKWNPLRLDNATGARPHHLSVLQHAHVHGPSTRPTAFTRALHASHRHVRGVRPVSKSGELLRKLRGPASTLALPLQQGRHLFGPVLPRRLAKQLQHVWIERVLPRRDASVERQPSRSPVGSGDPQ